MTPPPPRNANILNGWSHNVFIELHSLDTESLFSHRMLQLCVQLFKIKRVGYAAVSLTDEAGGSHCFLKIKDHLADFHLSSLTSGSADVILSMLFAGRAVGTNG